MDKDRHTYRVFIDSKVGNFVGTNMKKYNTTKLHKIIELNINYLFTFKISETNNHFLKLTT